MNHFELKMLHHNIVKSHSIYQATKTLKFEIHVGEIKKNAVASSKKKSTLGLVRDLNPGPLAP